jgi:hypothetical protein
MFRLSRSTRYAGAQTLPLAKNVKCGPSQIFGKLYHERSYLLIEKRDG